MSKKTQQQLLNQIQKQAISTSEAISNFTDFIVEGENIEFAVKLARFTLASSETQFVWSFQLECVSHAVESEIGKNVWFNIGTNPNRSEGKMRKDSYDFSSIVSATQLDPKKAMELMTDLTRVNSYLKGAIGKGLTASSIHKSDDSGSVFQNFDKFEAIVA
tara:strand:+ start:234 stop:716 length:483 start_codon:yes stop_codon:yes gene_type:complete